MASLAVDLRETSESSKGLWHLALSNVCVIVVQRALYTIGAKAEK